MNSRSFLIRTAIALALAGLFAGCGSDNLRIFFAIAGDGSCSTLIVEFEADAGGSEIAGRQGHLVDCVLDSLLEQVGCDVSFVELPDDRVRAVITGCSVPAAASVFSCAFKDADVEALQASASAQCDCEQLSCDASPPVCAGEDEGLSSCEAARCDNGVDDDGDDLVDCDDTDCEGSPDCESSTTTTLGGVTSTTQVIETCSLTFRLLDDVTVGSLQWSTLYDGSAGGFLGEGGSVECASLVEGSLAAFNDHDGEEILESGIVSLGGFTGPVNVAQCSFRSAADQQPDDFTITDVEAAEPDLTLIQPAPALVVGEIQCGLIGDPETTTTTSPSLTSTTLAVGVTHYSVLFELESVSAPLGALQFSVDYGDAAGGFQGSGGSVACANHVPGALFASNDDEASEKLTLGFIALAPFSAPAPLAQCTFEGTTPSPPGPFEVTIEDATDVDGVPATAQVRAVTGFETTTTTTLPADSYSVLLRLEEAGDALGSLGLTLDYGDAPGGFLGSGPSVACTNEVDGALFAANDANVERHLRLGWVSLATFSAPTDLAVCTFQGSTAPDPTDFPITHIEASNGMIVPTTATIGIVVTPLP